jgi:hypothetical protein
MGNSCSCKGCVISCIDKYSDCKDYINKEGKYNKKELSEIKIISSVNIQNILKTITNDTEMKRNEVESQETKVVQPQLTIKIDDNTEILLDISEKAKNDNNFKDPLFKKNNKTSEDDFEII